MLLVALPLQEAGTRPAGSFAWEANAGFSLLRIGVPALPVLPVPTAGVAAEVGLTDHVDLGARYTTWLGFDHRLGPELQVGTHATDALALGLRAHPSQRIAGTVAEHVELGGDVSGQLAAVASLRGGPVLWTLDVGPTVQAVLFERLDGVGFADTRPWLASVDFALEAAWRHPWAEALAVRLELAVPRAPDDPLSVLGVRPRIVLAGTFRSPSAGLPSSPRTAPRRSSPPRRPR